MLPRISGMKWAAFAGVLSACATFGKPKEPPKEPEKGRDFVAEFIPRPEWARRRDELLRGDTTFWQGQSGAHCGESNKLSDSLITDPDDPSVRRSGREEEVSSDCFYSDFSASVREGVDWPRAHYRRFAGGHISGDTLVSYLFKRETKYQKESCSEEGGCCQEEGWVPREEKTGLAFFVYGTARLDVLDGAQVHFQSLDNSLNVFLEGVPREIRISWGKSWGEKKQNEMDCEWDCGKWRCDNSYEIRYKGKLDDVLKGGLNAYYVSVALAGLLD